MCSKSVGVFFGGGGGPTHLLVKVSEEVDSERVLLVKFVPICILNSFESLGGGGVLQKDVPVEEICRTVNTPLTQHLELHQ